MPLGLDLVVGRADAAQQDSHHGGQTHSPTVLCPPRQDLQLTGDKQFGGLQSQGSVDSAGGENGQDDGEVADHLPHLQMEKAWPGLARVGGCPRSTSGLLDWTRDAHPHREVAAAPEALEHSTGEEGSPEEQEGEQGDIGHILAAGPQEIPTLIQALGPAQHGQGGRRL